mgnify:CR=1 FL=1
MGFKDIIAADIDIFTNTKEFGETHLVQLEGAQYNLPLIIDKNVSTAFGKGWDGTYQSGLQIAFRASLIERKPIKGQVLMLDSKRYMVEVKDEVMGLLVVTLEVPEG